MIPVLDSGLLQLVPLDDRHALFEHELDSDPMVMKYLTGHGSTDEESKKTHQRRMDLMHKQQINGLGYWIGYFGKEPVGLWMLKPPKYVPQDHRAELGYRILQQFWKRGLASLGSMAILKHGFEVLNLDSICAETMFVNAASRAVMTKIGMKLIRSFFEDYEEPLEGSEYGEVEYLITKEEWKQRQEDAVSTSVSVST